MRTLVFCFCVLFASTARAESSGAEDLTLTASKLGPALVRAAEHLAKCKTCTVTIKVAGGEQRGKAGSGQWVVPQIAAPLATLRILGAYDASFEKRAPFSSPTVLSIAGRRSGPVLSFSGKTELAEVVISGFAIDVGAGNTYDAKSGALHKGSSSTWPILSFGMITTDRLVISDNIFLNGAHGVAGPRINAASKESEIVVENNLFLGNVFCWQVVGLPRTPIVKRYVIAGNSFIGNYPFNPDRTTSNPGTLEIGNHYTAEKVEIRGNLFAHNSGGAIFAQWEESRGPKMELAGNLFFRNAALFGVEGDGKGMIVGKFNSAIYAVLEPREVEEDFSWASTGNVVLDPQLGSLDDGAEVPEEEGQPEEAGQPEEDEDGTEIVRNADIDAFGRRVKLELDRLPFPKAAAAQKYGASPSRVEAR